MIDEAEVEGEREVSAVYGYFRDADRFDFAYGADYPLIEPDYDEELSLTMMRSWMTRSLVGQRSIAEVGHRFCRGAARLCPYRRLRKVAHRTP